MSSDGKPSDTKEPAGGANSERREALIKLGKYAAYATPVVVASISAVQGAPVSGASPSPPLMSPPPPPTL